MSPTRLSSGRLSSGVRGGRLLSTGPWTAIVSEGGVVLLAGRPQSDPVPASRGWVPRGTAIGVLPCWG